MKNEKGIPRKEKHELKTRRGGSCKDKSMKGFRRRMTISTGGKAAIKRIFQRIQRRLLKAHCENHLKINLIKEPMCSFVWIFCSHFHLSWHLPHLACLSLILFSRINHYFLFFEILLEIHNWAFMHYCKRFRGQWKRNS